MLIELKTDHGSERPGQLTRYAEQALHQHPDHRLTIAYITPPGIEGATDELPEGVELVQQDWHQVARDVQAIWVNDESAGIEDRALAWTLADYLSSKFA